MTAPVLIGLLGNVQPTGLVKAGVARKLKELINVSLDSLAQRAEIREGRLILPILHGRPGLAPTGFRSMLTAVHRPSGMLARGARIVLPMSPG